MLHHFRFLNPLLPIDEDGMSPLHYYDSAIQLARNSARALSEEEFETGMNAALQIEKWCVCLRSQGALLIILSSLNECRLEMLETDSLDTPLEKE